MNLRKKQPSQKLNGAANNDGWQVVSAPELKPYSPEWFLSSYLDNWDNTDIDVAIRNDVRPDLASYAPLILDNATDFFMNFLKTQRPDLKRIQTKDGKEWIRRIIKSATTFQ